MIMRLIFLSLFCCSLLGCANKKLAPPESSVLPLPDPCETLHAVLRDAAQQIVLDGDSFSVADGKDKITFLSFKASEPSERNYFMNGRKISGHIKLKVINGQLADVAFEEGTLEFSTGRKCRIAVVK